METEIRDTKILHADASGINQAAVLLQQGALVSFATETVYGLGADARNDQAVARIYAAKNRPNFNPLIVHVSSQAAAQQYAHFNPLAAALAERFWPGPLTLVLPLLPNSQLSKLVSAGLTTVAIRVPAHPVAHQLLAEANIPIAAPSANPSGRISPTSMAHVLSGLDGKIDAVLDGGLCDVGLESTILALDPEPILLRAGGVPVEEIEAVIGHKLLMRNDKDSINAPGQLSSHYAPNAKMRLNVTVPMASERFLGFGQVEADLNLSPEGSLVEAAANLFRHLHQLDQEGTAPIAVSKIPDTGLGAAINDRLRRAAYPKE